MKYQFKVVDRKGGDSKSGFFPMVRLGWWIFWRSWRTFHGNRINMHLPYQWDNPYMSKKAAENACKLFLEHLSKEELAEVEEVLKDPVVYVRD